MMASEYRFAQVIETPRAVFAFIALATAVNLVMAAPDHMA
jgi:hypothetical protein